ncbi:Methyltransferase type 12 [Candidatus Burkholderia verschuerenii]|uniref:Methyltransferase type 12 n=1 Tax=Candidatus Burkholderia verschuerenii TaxID=242163 RepID=A0A0L0M7B7_9BURK|nr:class I SAM-dependent methyltransferase [Candidatus Burkholderia verschuerenii]KND57879.1 Methyltransferase type 12 [Candidatus Burkholderia verschuerenii]
MTTDRYFDDLYRKDDDPWKIRNRWYERRKRALLLAALPHERYARVFEPACGNGELTAALAPRCDEFIATDINDGAVALTKTRMAQSPHAKIARMTVPDEWPDGRFDLVVISEVGYYLEEAQLGRLIERIRHTLSPDGAVVACHWRRPIEGWALDGEQVHAAMRGKLGLPLLCHYWTTT